MNDSGTVLILLIFCKAVFLSAGAQYVETLLTISNGTGIGLFNLWHLSNVHCGNVDDGFFRSDIIDRFHPEIECPYLLYLRMKTVDGTYKKMTKYFTNVTLEKTLEGGSIFEVPGPTFPSPHVSSIHTADGFEYKLADPTGRYLYFGILRPSNNTEVVFYTNDTGYDLTNGLPSSTNVVKLEVIASFKDVGICNETTMESPVDVAACDEPPTVTASFSYIEAVYSDNITLQCTVDGGIPIDESFWDTVTQGQVDVDVINSMDMILNLESVTFAYTGIYRCCVANKLHFKEWDQIVVNVTGGFPQVTTTSLSTTLNTSESVTFDCSVTASPIVTDFYWRKRVSGVDSVISTTDSRFTIAGLSTPSLTITNLQVTDAGEYFCVASNVIGEGTSTGITLAITSQNTDLCPCSCAYRSKVDYWASHNVTNMTYDEIVVWLQPKIKELEKTLTVDKSNLSALINKRISMKDDRPSARSIGYIGIVILSVVFVLILFIDVTSITRHTQNIKLLWGVKKK
ncbi:uncharacterized protein LOC127737711 [Mytilus californianus]|uniref:uncharacterized protein LOC127737711 n=1 Tax=Mytilus californianus TaxID=6549 RepID=UPI0022454F0B|nr:uncharacterized protein LOC127737711 [Mytilus californianus]